MSFSGKIKDRFLSEALRQAELDVLEFKLRTDPRSALSITRCRMLCRRSNSRLPQLYLRSRRSLMKVDPV
jgi:hypothetical protein